MVLSKNQVIDNLIADTQKIISLIEEKVQHLSKKELNWKSSPDRWSILECLEHLNRYGDYYLQQFDDKINKAGVSNLENYQTGWLGNYAANSILPQNGRIKKIKTFRSMDPANSNLGEEVVTEFINQQYQMIQVLEKARKVDLGKNRIPITIAKWVRFKLGDAFRFHVYHNVRHMEQIREILKGIKKESMLA